MISIIIPVFNEAQTIGLLLQHLTTNSTATNIVDITIVDGGSTDGTEDIITKFISSKSAKPKVIPLDTDFIKKNFSQTGINLIRSEKGRAKQMNSGAKRAKGDILYFLHADSYPPQNFDQLIINEVKKGNEAGCFRMQFDSNHWWLRLASWLTQFNWRVSRGGDQSQFITVALFNKIGGYNESYIIYEDNILINELYARNQFTVINKKLTTSARLYRKHGIWKVQYHFWTIYVKKWFGASADDLVTYYKKNIC
ncbi:TIGR04283 family arsenosugar biosynthesis glycosyltransferase [Winogradskyella wichelsiae]|uniref:TIGR04283 family arsenosugar biosynthesis glycosyltransferase n=1 Tax=Winogradskyella wichelsiae TaxID=2697007 RepID=UPI0015C6F117|nr:TIGR04283 family arsenosugar biosynthesis glycosyltransferase [Winogradskyella wichelsiae]